ncbi:transcription elongation regulator [Phlyctochytrium planicorne]|nr:transcription elongation regulator [Phlyctochytrium planicorne]
MDPLDPEHEFKPNAARPKPQKPHQRRNNAPKNAHVGPPPGFGMPAMPFPSSMVYPPVFPGQPGAPPMMYPPGPPGMMMMPGMRPPPPPPPRPPPIPKSPWTEHIGPNGVPYFYNSQTKQSTWERPADFAPPPPPPGPPPLPSAPSKDVSQTENGTSQPAKTRDEWPIALKKLPNCPWAIVLTNKDNEFYANVETKDCSWTMPDEIGELIGQILAAPAPDDDEMEDEPFENVESAGNGHVESEHPGTLKRKLEEDAGEAAETTKKAKSDSLTNEQRHEQFMALLREKDVSPFTTWERELPKFIHDERYEAVKSAKERKQIFENYCKVRVVEIREERKSKSKETKEGFHKLLEEMVNHRTTWEEFARRYRKDSRFLAITEERERRSLFNEFLNQKKVERVKQKREEKQKMFDEYNDLLAECAIIGPKTLWRDVKKEIENDKRYLALLPADREELFYSYRKKLEDEEKEEELEDDKERKEREKKAREAASLKEREEAVRKQMAELDREVRGTKNKLLKEDSGTLFKTMLIDNVKSHDLPWSQVRADMEKDPRWDQCRLMENELRRLFEEHISHIYTRRQNAFFNLVDEIASLTTTFDEVSNFIISDPRAQQLKGWTSISGPYIHEATAGEPSPEELKLAPLRRLFERRQAERITRARQDLEDALTENKFIRFHVRNAVQSAQVQAVEKGAKEAAEGDEWRLINLDEIKQVMTDNKAFNDYEAFEQERERIVFTFVKSLIEEARAEKGGVLDKTIAAHAGGHFADKEKFAKKL